jgi:hypothetical protein
MSANVIIKTVEAAAVIYQQFLHKLQQFVGLKLMAYIYKNTKILTACLHLHYRLQQI